MESFFQVIGAVLVAVVLGLILSRQSGETGVLLTVAACCMVVCAAAAFLEPVLDFWRQLQQVGQLDGQWIGILMKAVGIGIVGEVAALVCSDAGNASLSKAVGILTAAAMLWLSIPLLQGLLELVREILEEV